MCRILAGTLIEVGKGNLSPEDVRAILNQRLRSKAGVSVTPPPAI